MQACVQHVCIISMMGMQVDESEQIYSCMHVHVPDKQAHALPTPVYTLHVLQLAVYTKQPWCVPLRHCLLDRLTTNIFCSQWP